jgi:hypothetical protein
MSKRAREFRAKTRRDDRYMEGRENTEDRLASTFGWNKARSRSLKKFERQAGELLMTAAQFEDWLFFGMWKPLLKGGRKK